MPMVENILSFFLPFTGVIYRLVKDDGLESHVALL